MKIFKLLIVPLLLSASVAFAQQTASPARAPAQNPPAAARSNPTPEQQAQIARHDIEMARAAAQVVQMVDQNRTTEIWEGASPIAKAAVTREDFVKRIAQDRQTLGKVAERRQMAINRIAYPAGGQVPAGNYVNVSYATKFSNLPQPVRELVSFHLDSDNIWRVTGYSVR